MGKWDYCNRHKRTKTRLGSPRDHPCADCGGQAIHWATIHDRDGLSPGDYRPLCNPCHIAYDGGHAGERNGRAKLTWEQVTEIRQRHAAGEGGYGTLAREYGIARSAIADIIKNRHWVVGENGSP